MKSPAINVNELTKLYGTPEQGVLAVNKATFDVRRGEVFGFLGPNGAGKTTTIRMLTGLAKPTAGSANVLGLDLENGIAKIKKRIGVVPEASNLYNELTAFDNLMFSMQLYGVPGRDRKGRAEELLDLFRLTKKRDVLFSRLSRGMKRSLTVAVALAHYPEIVFLDEPTTGLDVMSANSLRRIINDLREQGVTIFLTTHYLEEAERLCDRIALLVRGQVIALDTVEGIKSQIPGSMAIELVYEDKNGDSKRQQFVGIDVSTVARDTLALAEKEGWRIHAINTVRPTLQDAFVQLTGLSADVMMVDKFPGGKGK